MKRTLVFVFLAIALAVATSAMLQALTGGRWVPAPGNGVVVGTAGTRGSLIVCRANYDGGQHPGKVWDGTCNFGWGGVTHYSSTYEVLVDRNYRWITAASDGIPSNAIDGGDAGNAAGHARLGVCEVFNGGDNSWHPGKFYANKCNYAWGGSKTNQLGKEIAVVPNGNVHILVGN
jgi:hypothetical protein